MIALDPEDPNAMYADAELPDAWYVTCQDVRLRAGGYWSEAIELSVRAQWEDAGMRHFGAYRAHEPYQIMPTIWRDAEGLHCLVTCTWHAPAPPARRTRRPQTRAQKRAVGAR